jgi:Raf kinase inhibitor-like YbhB/YbcL family protein
MRAPIRLVIFLLVVANTMAKDPAAKLEIKSPAFTDGATIPVQFTCSGANISPALTWSRPPAGTKSLALIVDDPDAPAGTWVHWVVYNLPTSSRGLPQGVPQAESIADGGEQGLNDFPHTGYSGPCPPPGKPHRYFFRLYALDTLLNVGSAARRKDVDSAMRGHILAQGEWMGRFER